jgi:hypothetical protein
MSTMSSDAAGNLSYDCDGGGTVVFYPNDNTPAVKQIATDSDCEYFDDIADGPYIICAIKSGGTIPATFDDVTYSEQSKCYSGTLTKNEDNYIDLQAIATPVPPDTGTIHVTIKDDKGNPLNNVYVTITCDDKQTFSSYTDSKGELTQKIDLTQVANHQENCSIKATGPDGSVQTKTVTVKKDTTADVLFTFKLQPTVNPTLPPRTSFLRTLFGVQTAQAAAVRKTVNRTNLKKASPDVPKKPKEQSKGHIYGQIYTDNDGKLLTTPVSLQLVQTGPAIPNDAGIPTAPTWKSDVISSQPDGRFDFPAVEFKEKYTNTYTIVVIGNDYDSVPTKLTVEGTVAAQISLSKDSHWIDASGTKTTPYKQNGIQLFVHAKNVLSLKGHTALAQGADPNLKQTGTFTVTSPSVQYKTATTFDYKGTGYPQQDTPYLVSFLPDDATVAVDGYYDAASDQALPAATGGGAQVTLTTAQKSVVVVVKLKKKVQPQIKGVIQKLDTGITNDQGLFTVTPGYQSNPHVRAFAYLTPQLDTEYTVDFKPDDPLTTVEGYYDQDNPNTRIDPAKFTPTAAKPIIGVLVKLKKSSNTKLDVSLVPPDAKYLTTKTVDEAYINRLANNALKDPLKKMLDTINNLPYIKGIVGDVTTRDKLEALIAVRVPNKDIAVQVDNRIVGSTDDTGKVKDIDATRWVDQLPSIQAVQGTLPVCVKGRVEYHLKVPVIGKKIGTKVVEVYLPGTAEINRGNPINGKLIQPSSIKITANQHNYAEIKKDDFKPENLIFTLATQKAGNSAGGFWTDAQKLQLCMDGKKIADPKISASYSLPPDPQTFEKGKFILAKGEKKTVRVSWNITQDDGTPLEPGDYKATITVKVDKNEQSPETVSLSGQKDFVTELSAKGKEQKYKVTITLTNAKVGNEKSADEISKTIEFTADNN